MEKGYRVLQQVALMLIAAAVLVATNQVQAATQGSLGCRSCHGMAPVDSPTRDPQTGRFPGNHNTHTAGSSATVTECTRCHLSEAYSARHRDGKISFQSTINNSPKGAQYRIAGKDVPFRNQTTVPGRGACANANCHFESQTRNWGSDPLSSTADCSTCHAIPGASPGHSKHVEYYPGFSGCTRCHPDWASGLRFSHATSAGSRGIRVKLAEGSYSGTGRNFLPSQNGSRVFGNCSSTYCHSDGKSTPAYASATWGGAVSHVDCAGCHGNAASSATLSGKHAQHVNNAAYLGTNLKCADCHSGVTSSASDTVITNRSKHVNRFIDYSGPRAGRNGKDCSNIYCHSDGKGNSVNPGTWTAGTAINDCKACHGARTVAQGAAFTSVAGEPNYASGGGGLPNANSHQKHVGTAGASTCDACHALTTANGTSIISGSIKHLDGVIDVNLNPAKAGASATWGAGKTCSNVLCHSGGTAQWGAAVSCDLCHPAAALKGAHSKHLAGVAPRFYSYTGNHSYGNDASGKYEFGCSNCHPLTSADHTDGQVLLDFRPVVTGQALGTLRVKNSAAITTAGVAGVAGGTDPTSVPGTRVVCLNIYCHSNGFATQMTYAVTPNWYGGTFTGDRCANCHGNSPNTVTPGSPSHSTHIVGIHWEDIFSGSIGKLSAGTSGSVSHGVAGQSTTMNCNTCHSATVSSSRNDRSSACSGCHNSGTNPASIAGRALHVNGVVNVSLQPNIYLSKAQLRQTSFSVYTAAGGYWDRNLGNYKNGAAAFDMTKETLATGTWSAGSCLNVACHMNRPVSWNDSALDCINCHVDL